MSPSVRFFFAWGAFVFLPVNILAGTSLAKSTSPGIFVSGLALGLLLLALTVTPTVIVAVSSRASFSGALRSLLPLHIAWPIIGIIPIVNMGWFAIQLAALGILTDEISGRWLPTGGWIAIWAALCAIGPLLFGYRWLSVTGAIALLVAILVGVFELASIHSSFEFGDRSGSVESFATSQGVWLTGWSVFGTWAFSSASCVMDLARFSNSKFGTVVAAVSALALADISLIGFGYYMARLGLVLDASSGLPDVSVAVGFCFFIAGLWSTNDSNLYSTSIALQNMGARSKIWPWLFVCIAASFAIALKSDLFGWIGQWLILMGWIAIPLCGFWWYILLRQKHSLIQVDLTDSAS